MYSFGELEKIENRISLIGMKAESLIHMRKGGFNVPDGFVVCIGESAGENSGDNAGEYSDGIADGIVDGIADDTASDLANNLADDMVDGIADGIRKFANEKTLYAVRSSGTSEDLEGMSFAGQYDTYLNVQGFENLKKAVKDCQKSINNERVKAYAEKNNLDLSKSGIAVIVQKMVQSEKAGVAFSIDSLNGFDKEIIIEAVCGFGDKLVSGHITPDYYSYNWYEEKHTTYNGGALSKSEVKDLAEIILDIQVYYGFPVDVEWAIKKGVIYILQSRPITTFSYKAIPDEWTTADFRDGGVSSSSCKALMGSLYGLVFSDSFISSLKTIKVLDKSYNKSIYEMFFGIPYWNLTVEKDCFAKLPGYVEREIDEDMGVAPTYEGDGVVTKTTLKSLWNGIMALSAISKHIKAMERTAETKKGDLLRRFAPFESMDLSKKTGNELHRTWVDFVKNHYYHSEFTYFCYIFCNMILSTLFKDKIKGRLPNDEIMNLYVGLADLSHMRPIYEAWDLAHSKYTDSDIENFIEKYKYHSQHELDVSFPNWDETPDVVKDMINDFAKMGESKSPKKLGENQKKKYLYTLEKAPKKLHKEVDRLRSFLWWREEFREISTKSYYLIRKLALALGHAWRNEGVLEYADDIFYLTENDIEKKKNLKELSAKNRMYYRSFLNYKKPNEIGGRHNASESRASICSGGSSGGGCSGGGCSGSESSGGEGSGSGGSGRGGSSGGGSGGWSSCAGNSRGGSSDGGGSGSASGGGSSSGGYSGSESSGGGGSGDCGGGAVISSSAARAGARDSSSNSAAGARDSSSNSSTCGRNSRSRIGGAIGASSAGARGRSSSAAGGVILKGVPCSGETITGTARVIKDIHDSHRLHDGDILVTKCTDPAWTAVFSKIGGVITETGGMLSHAAVISREYGISCILVVKNATDVIKDGDTITMDCRTGEILKAEG